MHIAYSALSDSKRSQNKNSSARYRGYVAACHKHRETIAAIQQYLPGWQPMSPGSLNGALVTNFLYKYNY